MPNAIDGQAVMTGFTANHDQRPAIGEIMYVTLGHAFYREKSYLIEDEFLVCQAQVTGYYDYENIRAFQILICAPNVHNNCYLWHIPALKRVADIGKSVYWTPKEAAEKARKLTEEHDCTWNWCDPPMRRTWERMLDGGDFYLAPLISPKHPEGGGAYVISRERNNNEK